MFGTGQNALSQLNPLMTLSGYTKKDANSAKEAAQEFEAVFLKNMLEKMFPDIEEGGPWGGGEGADAWRSMMVDEYATAISKSGGIGLASSVERELLAMQEIQK